MSARTLIFIIFSLANLYASYFIHIGRGGIGWVLQQENLHSKILILDR